MPRPLRGGPRGLPAIALAIVLWPVSVWFALRSDPVETPAQMALAIAGGLACAVLLIPLRGRRRAQPELESAQEEVTVG